MEVSELPSHDVGWGTRRRSIASPARAVPSPNVASSSDQGRKLSRNEDRPGAGTRADPVRYDVKPTFSMRSSSVAFTVDPVMFGFIR